MGVPHARAPGARPGRPQGIRRRNLALVLGQVIERGPVSRPAIAEGTGLTKSTVSSLVRDLTAWGLVFDVGAEAAGTVGRPGRLVSVADSSVVGLGIEINVDYVATCIVDLAGTVRRSHIEQRDNAASATAATLDVLGRLVRASLAWGRAVGLTVVGIAVAAPGLVDVDSGVLLEAPNLGWRDVELRDEIVARLARDRMHVEIDNEANVAALGELWQGRGRTLGDFIHISGEIGVGAGIVVAGELLRGSAGLGGEIGHIPVSAATTPCACGSYGCLEQVVGQRALLRAAGLPEHTATRIGAPGSGVAPLVARARAGDPTTIAALHHAGTMLGRAVAVVVNLFAPDSVVLGGIYVPLHDWIVEPLRDELHARSFVLRHTAVAVVPSALGAAAAVRGAGSSALRTVIADPMLADPTRSATWSARGSG